MSIRATSRITGIDLKTILELLVLVGRRCKKFMEREIAAVLVEDVQVDEIWGFVGMKQKTAERLGVAGEGVGDAYCFTAFERHTKLVLTWHLGQRNQPDTDFFCEKLRDAAAPANGRYQLSTDGFQPYKVAVPNQLSGHVDYGMIIKIFGKQTVTDQRTYSPAKITGIKKERIFGNPAEEKICTSHTERHNGSMRLFNKRMARLTYCFSKKWGNHAAALALYFAHYNYCHKHKTLKGETPAMASGLANRVWTVRDLLNATAA
jgi:IS1 family transposase